MFHDRILKRMQNVGIKRKTLALLSGVSAPKLSDYLNGHCELPNGKDKQLDRVLEDIVSLQEYFPIPIGTSDSKLLRTALERFRQGKFERYRDLTKELAPTFDEDVETLPDPSDDVKFLRLVQRIERRINLDGPADIATIARKRNPEAYMVALAHKQNPEQDIAEIIRRVCPIPSREKGE